MMLPEKSMNLEWYAKQILIHEMDSDEEPVFAACYEASLRV